MPPKKGRKAAAKKSPAKVKEEEKEQAEEEALLDMSQENGDDAANTSQDQEMEVKLEEDEEVNGGEKRNIDDVENDDDDDDSSKKMKTDDEEEDPNKPITLFCGNLDPDLSTESLEQFFTANGIPVTNPRKIGFRKFGYVNITPDQTEAALALSGKELNGVEIKIDISIPKQKYVNQKNEADDRTLFVKNLHEATTEETLRQFFVDYGKILSVRLPKKPNGKCKGFGYVVFEKEEMMEKAKEEKQGAELNNEKLFLDFTNEKSEHYQEMHGTKEYGPSKVLFVRNVSFQVSEEELKEIFDGSKAARIPPDQYGNPKGFAFIEYETVEEAEKAKTDKDGLEINGRVVQLAFADDKESGNAPRRRPQRRGGMWGPRGRGGPWGPWGYGRGMGPPGRWEGGGWGWGGRGGRGGHGMMMPPWGFGGPMRGRGRGGRKRY